MTVGELINNLEKFDENLLVMFDLSYYGYEEVDIVKCELSDAYQTVHVLIE